MSFVPTDLPSTLRRVVQSINVAVDWLESGTPDDQLDAALILNYCLDDLERLLAAPEMREPDSSPGPSSRDAYLEQSYHSPRAATSV